MEGGNEKMEKVSEKGKKESGYVMGKKRRTWKGWK